MAEAIRDTWLSRDRDDENFEDEYSCLYCDADGSTVWAGASDKKHRAAIQAINHEHGCPVLVALKAQESGLEREEILDNAKVEIKRLEQCVLEGFGGYDQIQAIKRVVFGRDSHGRTSKGMDDGTRNGWIGK